MELQLDENYWKNRYLENQISWDIGYTSTPLKNYFDQLTDKSIRILIPGGGNSYEAEYLYQQGFDHVFVVDIAKEPLQNLKSRVPSFPEKQLLHTDFFDLNQTVDLIVEQTFFCALNPILRPRYASKMAELLQPKGKLVGLLFDDPLYTDHPPFGGNREEYQHYFQDKFHFKYFETCYNSIKPRQGRELFINLQVK